LRLRLLKQQAKAGDITLLFGDESEALTHPSGPALQHYHDVKFGVVPVPSGACRGWREVGSHQLGQDPTVRRRRDAEIAVHEEVTQPTGVPAGISRPGMRKLGKGRIIKSADIGHVILLWLGGVSP
jgi:hypothetical protein